MAENLFPTVRALWLLGGRVTSNNDTVCHQNLGVGNIAKSTTRVTVYCYPQMLTVYEIYLHKFVHKKVFLHGLYNSARLRFRFSGYKQN